MSKLLMFGSGIKIFLNGEVGDKRRFRLWNVDATKYDQSLSDYEMFLRILDEKTIGVLQTKLQ